MWRDGRSETGLVILPKTIAAYFAILADLIAEFLREVTARGLLTNKEVAKAVNASLKRKTVPRRFAQMSALRPR